MQRKLHQTIKRITDEYAGRWHFNTCIAAIMEFVNEAGRGEYAEKFETSAPTMIFLPAPNPTARGRRDR